MLRKTLGGQPDGHAFIETVPRVGYRFIAPVKESTSGPKPVAGNHKLQAPARQEIRFCMAPDKVHLAYATVGSGHPFVKVANCFNHLDFEW